jgi:transglutaminase-like putative cysteine protease
MGGALLFWGWENGLLIWGALLAVVLESSRLGRARWEFSNTDLNRISDLCWALVTGTGLLLYSTEENRLLFIFRLVQWLPVCFAPLMLAQAYGNRTSMPLSVFWWLLRRSPDSPAAGKSYNISYCYFGFCLLATSASTEWTPLFYPGVTLLVALALTSARPRRVSLAAWVVLLALAATTGQFGNKGLRSMQDSMERVLGTWLADFFRPSADAKECPTHIGNIGPIPQSGKIVLRVRPEPGDFAPALLRETTWDTYKRETWMASNIDVSMARQAYNDSFKFLPTNILSSKVEIACYYDNNEGVLALPHGTFEVDGIPTIVSTNRLGVALIENPPGLLDMQAVYGPGRSFDSPPTVQDKMVPDAESNVMAQVAANLKLSKMTERQKIRAVERFFADPANHFTYTLNLSSHRNMNPLAYFLTKSRCGHCEYFATATVLLLREAGISARYATGYAVKESERHGDTYLVRARDAHSWVLVYDSHTGLWEQIDTTPGYRDKGEAAEPTWWEPISDALSNLYFQFSKWRWSKTSYAHYSIWLLIPMILYLIGRIIFSQSRRRGASRLGEGSDPTSWPGLDSELYMINQKLEEAQLSRLPNEPLLSWQQRLELAFPNSDRLRRIFHLHRSLRFDPHGLKEDDREILRNEARRWLDEFTARMEEQKLTAPSVRLRAPV